MKVLVVLNRNPYDGTDVTWNALRLVEKLLGEAAEPHIFLMNDAVDLAKEGVVPPPEYFNLTEMLTGLMAKHVPVRVCGTCLTRCGIHKNKNLIAGAQKATMPELAQWLVECDKAISF